MHVDTRRIVRRLSGVALGLILPLGACSDAEPTPDEFAEPTPVEFAELCGEEARLRLLAVDVDRVPTVVEGRAYGDRYVFSLGFGEPEREREFWSVGPCGEDPVRLVDSIDTSFSWMLPAPGLDLPVIWDQASKTLLVLDPSGAQPPHEPFATESLWLHGYTGHGLMSHGRTAHGLVGRFGEGDTGPLVLQRWPNDPLTEVAEQVVLLDEVRLVGAGLRVYEDEALALTADDEIVSVSLVDLEVRVLVEGVSGFDTGSSQRFILWQGLDLVENNYGDLIGPLFLFDRESGESMLIDDGIVLSMQPDAFSLEALGLLYYRPNGLTGQAVRVFRLDTLARAPDLPRHFMPLWGRVDDTRALLWREYSDTPLYAFDGSSDPLTPLYGGPVVSMSTYDPGAGPSIWIQSVEGGELLDLNVTTGQTRTFANRASHRWAFISGARVVTPIAVGDDGVGSLVVVNPDTLAEMYIDHGVLSGSLMLLDEKGLPHSLWSVIGQVSTNEAVSYMVVDADPERHGIWLAKPAK